MSGRLLCNACGHEKRLAPAWIDELRARAPEAAAENDVIAYFLHRFKCSQCQAKNFNIVPEEVAPKAEDDGAASPLCTKCGDVISFKRLRAVPGTPFCIHCQEEFEKARARTNSTSARNAGPGWSSGFVNRSFRRSTFLAARTILVAAS